MNAFSSLMAFGGGLGLLLLMVVLPALLSLVCLALSRRSFGGQALVFFLGAALNLILTLFILFSEELTVLLPWAGFEINLALRIYGFSRLMLILAAALFFLIALYSLAFMRRENRSGQVFFYCLLALAFTNGVFLANNFVTLLFFWEGILAACFAAQLYNDKPKVRTAVKTLVLGAAGDIMLIVGVAQTAAQSGTLMMDVVSGLPIEGAGVLGFIGLTLGALARACAVPFQSWLPDAAAEAPLPFVVTFPVCLERLAGAYLLLRVTGGFYDQTPGSPLSVALMIVGVLTFLAGGMMAMIQRNLKRVLAFVAIGQAGLILLGAGSAVPAGSDGAILSLFVQVPALMCMFFAAGQVEQSAGSSDLRLLGGLGHVMPVTGIAF
ncbi:MAG: NADH-quinone oxidoreductase subunit L, partial [Firmicutes bacterium]|nr:NADH-quinone oxidoreductase subunit L [Bacillota bacterium]